MNLSNQNGSVTVDITGHLENHSDTLGTVGEFEGIALIDGAYTM